MTTTTEAELPTEGEYTDAINTLEAVYGRDAEPFISMIETVKQDETFHATDNKARVCVDDCMGCLTERIADAITRAVNGKAA